jgi:hypothetical protein
MPEVTFDEWTAADEAAYRAHAASSPDEPESVRMADALLSAGAARAAALDGASDAPDGDADRRRRAGKHPRKVKDDVQFAGFCRRMIRAFARRAGECDPTILPLLVNLLACVEEAIVDVIEQMRKPRYNGMPGYSWDDIAAVLPGAEPGTTGITRQAAMRRWNRDHRDAKRAGR